MPDDLLPPETPVPPLAPPASPESRRTRPIVCAFCDCELDPYGGVLRKGEAAGKYLDLEDRLKKLQERLDISESRVTELSGQLDALKTPQPKRGGFLGNI